MGWQILTEMTDDIFRQNIGTWAQKQMYGPLYLKGFDLCLPEAIFDCNLILLALVIFIHFGLSPVLIFP